MSFLKKLFGIGGGAGSSKPSVPATDYKDFKIVPNPQADGAQYRLAGTISKVIDGEEKTHMLIRADMFSSHDEAVEATLRKARHVIDEQGTSIF